MEQRVLTAISEVDSLPLSSLRLLVPPVQLMTASMWQVLKRGDVMSYWSMADFVSLVVDMVPELLMPQHRTQLDLGLRARYVLELCRRESLIKTDLILPLLERMKSPCLSLTDVKNSEEEEAMANFLGVIETLLKDPEERQNFFLEVFPGEYGPDYDNDLQMLFCEFICRLAQLLPVPDLQQTVSWLSSDCSVFEDCVQSVSMPTDFKNLLQHHKNLSQLEQHVPPSGMGHSILSSLSAVLSSTAGKPVEQGSQSEPSQSLGPHAHTVSFMDDVAVEVIAVTDYAEIELGTSNSVDVVVDGSCCEGGHVNTEAACSSVVLPDEKAWEEGEQEEEEAKNDSLTSELRGPAGLHDCPDCQKKFRFASSLIAHRVIHTGERPHRCTDCGHCFSFRQSLDRHRRTHKTTCKYKCALCGEAFSSASARAQHKQTHRAHGGYTCHQCSKKFNWELALARHLLTHTEEHGAKEATGSSEAHTEAHNGDTDPRLPAGDDASRGPEVQSSHRHTSEGQKAEEAHNCAVAAVTVRTSGRKRRPTLKIQVINSQKQAAMKKKEESSTRSTHSTTTLNPVPFNSGEHSYGSSVVSSKDANEIAAEVTPSAFSCPKCSYQHSEEVQVQLHINEVHCTDTTEDASSPQVSPDEEGQYACGDCGKSYRFQSLLRAHQRSHTGEQPFLCSQCGQRFSFKQSLERHKHTHTSGRKYECPICGEVFTSLAAQREHKSTHMENGEFLCSKCGRAFAWKSALVRHLKTHGVEADGDEPSYSCSRCQLSFTCAGHLNRHLQTHQQERLHTCNCGKSFAYRAALTAHQRIHRKERPHTCPQCGKGFLYKGGLLNHMKIHSEEMPFMCSFCGKSFKRERNMKKHERCHTRENVFSCSQCDKSFVYKATLVRHELTHSGERPFLCSDCGKGFFSHAELLKHERFHTGHKPFQCTHCGKQFTQSCYLTIHLRYHTGVRPYACTECDKSFLSANRLKRHQRTHSGERPYVCAECGKGFRQSYNLKIHQRTHVLTLM